MRASPLLAALLVAACSSATPTLGPSAAPSPTPAAPATAPATATAAPTPARTIGEFVDAPLPAEMSAALQAALDGFIAVGTTPSISAAVIVPGLGTWSSAVGAAETAADRPATPDTVYAMGSITKTYVAALIMRLAEDGYLGLDDPASDHLGEVAGSKTNGATVRQLLGHRSGIFNYTEDPRIFDDRPWSAAEVLDLVGEPRFEAGERFEYSNTNYLLLGLIAEVVTGAPLTELLHEYLFGPYDLDRTYYGTAEPAAEPVAHGYLTEGAEWRDNYDGSGKLPNENTVSAARAAGAIAATPSDVARWMFRLYAGDVLADSSLAEMLDFSASVSYGLGVGRFPLPDGRQLIGHDGGIPGFISIGSFERSSGVVVVVVTNGEALDLGPVLARLYAAASD